MALVSDGATTFLSPFGANSATIPSVTIFSYAKFTSTPSGSQNFAGIFESVSGLAILQNFTAGSSSLNFTSSTDNSNVSILADPSTTRVANKWYPIVGTFTPTTVTFLGVEGSATATGSLGAATYDSIQFLGRKTNGTNGSFLQSGSELAEIAMWTTLLSPAEQSELVFGGVCPWNVRRSKLLMYCPLRFNTQDYGPNHFPFSVVGTGNVNFLGNHPILDGMRLPEANRTFYFAPQPASITGTLNEAQGTQTVAGTGTVLVGGTLSQAQGAQTVAGTGGVLVSGSLSEAQGVQTVAGIGKVLVSGTLSEAQGTQTAAGTGGVLVSGTLSEAQGIQTVAGTGSVISGIGGSLNEAQGTQTVAGVGAVAVSGTLSVTQGVQTLAGTGIVTTGATITGTLNATQGTQTLSAFGQIIEDDMPIQTAQDLINFALRASGIIGVGQTALAEDNQDALSALNAMIGLWMRKRWLDFHTTDNAFTSTGAQSYTVGPGGNFNLTNRPNRLEKAFFRQFVNSPPNAVDYPLQLLESREDYDDIALKSLSSWPQYIFYDPAFPLGSVYPWPIPQAGIYELHLTFRGPEMQEFTTYTQLINLPPEYIEALWTNLCLRLGPIYGFPVSDDIRRLANDALQSIRMGNAAVPRLRMPAFMKRNALYDIFSDQSY